MKHTIAVALVVAVTGVNAQNFHRRALAGRSVFGGDSTTNVHGGTAGLGGKSRGGDGGGGGPATGHKAGNQRNTGGNGASFGNISNEMNGAQTGMIAGNAAGGTVYGSVTNNAGAPFQFGGGMFDSRLPKGLTISSDNSISRIGSGGDASVRGTNNNRNGGLGDNIGNGGRLGGDTRQSGDTKSRGGQGGWSKGGRGGSADVGGGNSSKGGDGKLDFSPKLAVSKRSLDRRALELEEEYAWILQQKRDLEMQDLVVRYAAPEDDEEYLVARSEDPEAELFYAREAEFEEDDSFAGLTARDIWNSYLEMTSDY